MEHKQCTACSKTLPLTDFYVDNSREDGRTTKCRDCTKAYNKAWREANGIKKPEGWERKTSDQKEYGRQYRLANPEKFKNKRKRTPEEERAKYERKMRRLHGEDWKPSVNRPPCANDEERAARRKERNKKKREARRADPGASAKDKSRRKVWHAVKAGRLVRQPCEVCGALEVEAHHDDYSKPLDVRWLCPEHHRTHHATATT